MLLHNLTRVLRIGVHKNQYRQVNTLHGVSATQKDTQTMKPESISIDEVQYVRADTVAKIPTGNTKIVVLQRGWVLVGNVSESEADPNIRLMHNAAVIRVWGTTKGLGELRSGPTSSTKLDPAGIVEFHILTQVLAIPVDEAAWKTHLKK